MIAPFECHVRRSLFSAAMLVLTGGVTALSDSKSDRNFDEAVVTEMLPVTGSSRHSLTNGRAVVITVLNEEDGRPLAGALLSGASYVRNIPETTPQLLTDDLGRAVIHLGEIVSVKRMEAQRFTISVDARGFAGRGLTWGNGGKDARAAIADEITVKLNRGDVIGGTVRDSRGNPLGGVKVFVQGSSFDFGGGASSPEFARIGDADAKKPLAITDATGRWEIPDVSRDLTRLELEFLRPDGSISKFGSDERVDPLGRGRAFERFKISEVRDRSAEFVLRDGFTVRGIIVDLGGASIPNVLVKEGYGMGRPKVVNEFRTDSKGRFELSNRAEREMILTAEAENYAIGSTVVAVGPESPMARITLQKLSPLRIRVTDEVGKPVAGARISPTYQGGSDGIWPRLEGIILDLEAETDSEGVAIWRNAPAANLILTAQSDARKTWRTVSVDAAATRDLSIQLRPGSEKEFFIRVKAVEEGTGKPVVIDRVYLIEGEHENPRVLSSPKESDFTFLFPIDIHWKGPGFGACKLRFEADGYGPVFAPEKGYRDFNGGDWTVDLVMRPRGKPSGWVSTDDGEPVSGARVVASVNSSSFPLLQDGGKLSHDERHINALTDSAGYFELKDTGIDCVVIISHEKGFLETRTGILRSKPRLTLQRWGRVEGVLRLGKEPAGEISLGLSNDPPQDKWQDLWMVRLGATTDPEGNFTFKKVPPGRHTIYRFYKTQTYPVMIDVKAGETTRIEDGGKGRTIRGRVPPTQDWSRDVQLLVTPQVTKPFPFWDDYASRASFDLAHAEYLRQSENRIFKARKYPVLIEKDGTFRVCDVPPGEYELQLKVTEPAIDKPRFRSGKVLASLTRKVIVPANEGDEPLNLGDLEIISEERKSAEFSASTLDGRRVSLAQYRGKPLLLIFWAGWSKNSANELRRVTEITRRFGDEIAVIGVNVSDSIESVKSEVVNRGYSLEQTVLSGSERARVTSQFDVETLPSVALIDRNGLVVGRNLPREAWRAAVEGELRK
jgi:hypothetical protein